MSDNLACLIGSVLTHRRECRLRGNCRRNARSSASDQIADIGGLKLFAAPRRAQQSQRRRACKSPVRIARTAVGHLGKSVLVGGLVGLVPKPPAIRIYSSDRHWRPAGLPIGRRPKAIVEVCKGLDRPTLTWPAYAGGSTINCRNFTKNIRCDQAASITSPIDACLTAEGGKP